MPLSAVYWRKDLGAFLALIEEQNNVRKDEKNIGFFQRKTLCKFIHLSVLTLSWSFSRSVDSWNWLKVLHYWKQFVTESNFTILMWQVFHSNLRYFSESSQFHCDKNIDGTKTSMMRDSIVSLRDIVIWYDTSSILCYFYYVYYYL